MREISVIPNVADMQDAMRALWPDRAVVYFTEASAGSLGDGPVLTDEERGQLARVTAVIADSRRKAEMLADRLEQDAATGEYAGGHYARDVLTDVARRIRKAVA